MKKCANALLAAIILAIIFCPMAPSSAMAEEGNTDRGGLTMGTSDALTGAADGSGSLAAQDENPIEVDSWDALQSAIDSVGNEGAIKLSRDINAGDDDDKLLVERDGISFSINLNGYVINRNLTGQDDDNGQVFEVRKGTLTISDSSLEKTGKITGGYGKNGGGFLVCEDGHLIVQSGSIIGNRAYDGGGIYVDKGKLTMSGGSVIGNIGYDCGGIYNDGGTIVLTSVSISNNNTRGASGAGISNKGTATVADCTISDNVAEGEGGGIYNGRACNLTLTSCAISNNKSGADGGALCSYGTSTLDGCTISDNEAGKSGGAIRVHGGTVSITSSEISGNVADVHGGAIYVNNNGNLDLHNGANITKNTGNEGGGGIWVAENAGNVSIYSGIHVIDNRPNDVYLTSSKMLAIWESLSGDTHVGVALEDGSGTFIRVFDNYNPDDDPSRFFSAEPGYSIMKDGNGGVKVVESDWALLQRQIDEARFGDTIILNKSWKAIDENDSLKIPADKSISIDLNGYTIDRHRSSYTENGEVITVNGELSLFDSSSKETGTITGGNGDCGGIRVNGSGSLVMRGGVISGNKAKLGGGGIRVSAGGNLYANGGEISGNASEAGGGGIYNSGTMTLENCKIAKNTADGAGGGVFTDETATVDSGSIASNAAKTGGGICVSEDGTLDINGGSIASNTSRLDGGALCVSSSGEATINAGNLTGNSAGGCGGGVKLEQGATLNLFGGTIAKNNADVNGGGVYNDKGTFAVKDAPQVTGNTAMIGGNILLTRSSRITVSGALSDVEPKALLDVITQDPEQAITTGFAAHNCDISCFATDGSSSSQLEVRNGELYIKREAADVNVSTWEELQNAIKDDANQGKVIGLEGDISAKYDDVSLVVEGNKEVTIDLNGHRLDRNLGWPEERGGHVFEVSSGSTLNIKDSIGTGIIEGGRADNGGGIFIQEGAKVDISGGAILNNMSTGDGGGIYVLGTLTMSGGTVVQNKSDAHGGGICASGNGKLNLKSALIAQNESGGEGGGLDIRLEGEQHITDCTIRDNKVGDNDGGGINLDEGDLQLEIKDTDIIGNSSGERRGGGIFLNNGRVNMTGGSISQNQADEAGGGIYNIDCVIVLDGVTVSDNTTGDGAGAGIYNKDSGTVQLKNSTLSGNISKDEGGALYTEKKCSAEIENCSFENNESSASEGGAICAVGSATIANSTFTGNKAATSAGAICVHKEVAISGATMSRNEAKEYGGAIRVKDGGTLNLDGTTAAINIAQNGALLNGSGIWVSGDAGDITMKGAVVVFANDANSDLCLDDGKKIKVTGDLTGSQTRVVLSGGTGTFTTGLQDTNSGKDPYEFFLAQEGSSVTQDENGEGEVVASDWARLQRKINTMPDGSTIIIVTDFKAVEEDKALSIPAGKSITIDLNGSTIDRARTKYSAGGEVFTVDGTLTIMDTSQAGTGKVTGGYGDGGGIVVNDGGTLALKGGYVTDNKAKKGGGVLVNAGGTFNMSGGTITKNRAESDGGGVYNSKRDSDSFKSGSVNLLGGTITDNEAIESAGGFWFGTDSFLAIAGELHVTGNHAPIGANLLSCSNAVIAVNSQLAHEARIDFVSQSPMGFLTSGLTSSGSGDVASSVFSYNGESDRLGVSSSGELYLKSPTADKWVNDWEELQNAINGATSQGTSIALGKDITAGENDGSLVLDGKNVTIDLNGHKLDRHLDEPNGDGHVFELKNNSTLTIIDSGGAGRITGGFAECGGAVNIHEGSTCNIEGGAITGNRSSEKGGAIFVVGTFNMTGGFISNNESHDGGGIYVHDRGDITLENVNLVHNISSKHGGGAIDNKGTAKLTNCLIKENSADVEGGGIYNGAQKITLTDCVVSANSASQGGGIFSFGTVELNNTKVTENQADEAGGGAYVHGTLNVSGGEFSGNSEGDGGGICNDGGTVDIKNAALSGNRTNSAGGAINNKGKATLTNCTASDNTANAEGGCIYTDGDSDTTLIDCTVENNEAGGDGGGICAYGDLQLSNCTLARNKTRENGGALRNHGTTTVAGGSMAENSAEKDGGGIHIDNGSLTLDSAMISKNSASCNGSGLYVADGTDAVNIKGALSVSGNDGGSDVRLASGQKLTVAGSLEGSEGAHARMDVSTEGKPGIVFTDGFADSNPNADPAKYFVSSDDYVVYLEGGEASTKLQERDENPFVDFGSQMNRDYDGLNGKNWMSGISGERHLNEINMPGSHDSGTKVVEGNISTDMLSVYRDLSDAGVGLIIFGSTGVGASLGLELSKIVSDYFLPHANSQTRFIDEQLEDGVRALDISLNTYYAEQGYPIVKNDNGEDLYLVHGGDRNGGSYFAKDRDGSFLTFKAVLGWIKDFLEKHPTETIIMGVQIDSVDDVYDEGMARIKKHLREELATQINPSTGKPYLYTEDGVFGKAYSEYPQLKDCRGQVLLSASDEDVEILGGLKKGVGLDRVDEPAYSSERNAEAIIRDLTEFYANHGYNSLPTAATGGIDYYYSAGTNGADTRVPPKDTPLDIAADVLPVLFGNNGLLLDRVGKYLGLVTMDAATAANNEIVWRSNFSSALKYYTVTVKSGIDSDSDGKDDCVKTYTVLYDTMIRIPGCIYDNPNAQGKYFQGWKMMQSESTTGLLIPVSTGYLFKVTDNVTFTAAWGDQKTPIEVLWKDAENKDNLRPDRLEVKTSDGQTLVLKSSDQWMISADGELSASDLAPNWDKIGADTEGMYSCEVREREDGVGIVIELTHTPSDMIQERTATVNWVDNENADGKRPENVTLHLLANNRVVDSATVDADDGWAWDFGERPLYESGEEVVYSIDEEDIEGYTHYTKGFAVTNARSDAKVTTEFGGLVFWVDNDNANGKRPAFVTLNLLKNGKQIATQRVIGNESDDWLVDFSVNNIEQGDEYSITEEAIVGYSTQVFMPGQTGGTVVVVNTIDSHEHKPQTITAPELPATCTSDGKQTVYEYCSECGETLSSKDEVVSASGHAWRKWHTTKEATKTEEGLEERTCSNDPSHVQSRVIPKTDHVHNFVHVEAKNATCTEDGSIECWVCKKSENSPDGFEPCGLRFLDKACTKWVSDEDAVTPALGHDWGEPSYKWSADGTRVTATRVCKHDASHVEQESVAAEKTVVVPPTCTEAGSASCKSGPFKNGAFAAQTTNVEVPALGHDWGAWEVVKRPTALDKGLRRRACKRDAAHVQEEPVPATGAGGVVLARMSFEGDDELTLEWSKVEGAEGYDVFFSPCSKRDRKRAPKKVQTLTGNGKLSWTKGGLKKGVAYKAYVRPWATRDGKKVYLKKSPTFYGYAGGYSKTRTNARKVVVAKSRVTLRAGAKFKIKARVVKLKKNRKLISSRYAPKLRYLSTDATVAKVSKRGKIKAVGKGTCKVYAYAASGARKAVNVTVK